MIYEEINNFKLKPKIKVLSKNAQGHCFDTMGGDYVIFYYLDDKEKNLCIITNEELDSRYSKFSKSGEEDNTLNNFERFLILESVIIVLSIILSPILFIILSIVNLVLLYELETKKPLN